MERTLPVGAIGLMLLLASCQVMKPYAPPPQPAFVEEVEIITEYFEGRADYYAIVKGRLSSSVAVLVDSQQSRENFTLYIEVMEQTPRGAVPLPDLTAPPPFESRIPLETLGLLPGEYTVNVNGILTSMEISDEIPEELPPAPDPLTFL